MTESSERAGIGEEFPTEWSEYRDPETGRQTTQLTNCRGNCWALYYFIPSITADGRHLIFHGERSGWVQLYRMELETGRMVQLTDGHTQDSGWPMWCEWHLRGIYTHLSALNRATNEVWYFQDNEIRATHVETIANRLVAALPPGRIAMGQTDFSPDGSLFAFIHADREAYVAAMRRREALSNMGLWSWGADHEPLRKAMGKVVLATINTVTGEYRQVAERDFHFHHVLFADNETLLVNHPEGHNGMWIVKRDGTGIRELRPPEAPGAHNAALCHQVITRNGIYYEANNYDENAMCLGRYDMGRDQFSEIPLSGLGYCHTGFDPAGQFLFIESAGETHRLLSVHHPHDPARMRLNCIRTLSTPVRAGQRFHAHPFLTPDRNGMIFTDISEKGSGQIFRVDVSDLVNLPEYW